MRPATLVGRNPCFSPLGYVRYGAMMALCAFSVYGKPVPQGSVVAHVKDGRASIHYAQGSGLAVWRNMISAAARDAWGMDNVYGGPFHIELTFRMKRPRTHYADLKGTLRPQAANEQPAVMPDLDKLVRAVLDSLTGIVWHDDGQVVTILAQKVYADSPGLDVTIR